MVDADNSDANLALATQGYGVGNWCLNEGDTTRAIEKLKEVVAGKTIRPSVLLLRKQSSPD